MMEIGTGTGIGGGGDDDFIVCDDRAQFLFFPLLFPFSPFLRRDKLE